MRIKYIQWQNGSCGCEMPRRVRAHRGQELIHHVNIVRIDIDSSHSWLTPITRPTLLFATGPPLNTSTSRLMLICFQNFGLPARLSFETNSAQPRELRERNGSATKSPLNAQRDRLSPSKYNPMEETTKRIALYCFEISLECFV